MIGYRNESLYGSGIRDLKDVIEFEIVELCNTDIPETILNTFGLTNLQHRYLKSTLRVAEDRMDEASLQSLSKTCLNYILRAFPKAKYCLWLCSKNAVRNNYEGVTGAIDAYEIEIEKPISDLGFDDQGCLYLFTKQPRPIRTEAKQQKCKYTFTGSAEYYNRETDTTTTINTKRPISINAVSDKAALSNAMYRLKKLNNIPVNHTITLKDYSLELVNCPEDADALEKRTCDNCGTRLTDAGECPKCNLLDSRYNESVKKLHITEDFVNDLIVGTTYFFTKGNTIRNGKFKRKTPAWLIFEDENGEEIYTEPWSSVATNKEDIEQLIAVVDRMEKDTKIPSQVPNRFTKVPNLHGKPFGESKLTEGIWAYQTWTRTGNRNKPVYTLTYGGNVIAKYDKNDFEFTLGRDWERHIDKLIEWLAEYYPSFFIKKETPDSASYDRFYPTADEAREYIKNKRSVKFTEALKNITEDRKEMIYFMHIMDFDTDSYIVGKTPEECLQNAKDALERLATYYGGYDSYAEYLEIEHELNMDEFVFEAWLENYYGVMPIKIDGFYIWGE
jgi:predicted RNase H-like HicB family nuclease